MAGGARLADHLAVGYLAMNCPLDRVRAVLAAHAAHSKRRRGLPHEVLVYFAMAMCLYGSVAYEEVLRFVIAGLRELWGDEDIVKATVSKGAISQSRHQVGVAPLRQLYEEQVVPIGAPETASMWYRGHRLMAIDGSTLEMPDELGNAKHFGYPGASRGNAAFPQMRCVSLVKCGTHVLCHAQAGPYAQSEAALAERVLPHLDPTMLLMADRGFFGHPTWHRRWPAGPSCCFTSGTTSGYRGSRPCLTAPTSARSTPPTGTAAITATGPWCG